MAGTLERRSDGSLTLTINGDLQFDSADERIYHECLVLPALALSNRRHEHHLTVLVVGGGDGLCAREIFKSEHIAQVTLVDYDATILSMGNTELSALNDGCFSDSRLVVHQQDAWEFVSEAVISGAHYDLIVCDLTVPSNIDGARFHSIDWYLMLSALSGETGVIAVNGLSPQATPWAFCSIFNSMAKADLQPRPYHVSIPSFAARGYGDDWGFFIASKTQISEADFLSSPLPEPRHYLSNVEMVRSLFSLPEELFAVQPLAQPALKDSAVLLRYFHKDSLNASSGRVTSSLDLDMLQLEIPSADAGTEILPVELSAAFTMLMGQQQQTETPEPADPTVVLQDILQMMPSLQASHTPEMIEDFLEQPDSFLQAIDLQALVSKVLQKAEGTLPPHIVAELNLLASKFADWTGDQFSLLQLGRSVVTLLTLLMIIGNLMYPDAAYAKGSGHAAAHAKAATGGARDGKASRARPRPGFRGRRVGHWYNGWAWNGTTWLGENEFIRRYPKNPLIKTIPAPARKAPIKPEIIDYQGYNDEGTRSMLLAEREEATAYHAMLTDELNQYLLSDDEMVPFGMCMVPKAEAVRKTQQLLAQAEKQLATLEQQLTAPDSQA